MHTTQELLNELKALWGIQGETHDQAALDLIQGYFQTHYIDQEQFDIQQKVLAKTREKTEALLKRLDRLEQQ